MVAGFLFICYVNMNFMKNMEWEKQLKYSRFVRIIQGYCSGIGIEM